MEQHFFQKTFDARGHIIASNKKVSIADWLNAMARDYAPDRYMLQVATVATEKDIVVLVSIEEKIGSRKGIYVQ